MAGFGTISFAGFSPVTPTGASARASKPTTTTTKTA